MHIDTHADVVSLWFSAAELARDLGLDPQVVQKWRTRKVIPAKYWPALIEAGKRRRFKITADMLMRTRKW